MSVRNNLEIIRKTIPKHVKMVAVSKTMPINVLLEAYEMNQRLFGENKMQELIQKQPLLPKDIQWHFIGHLQTNKVKFIAPFISMIESVDSLKLLREINNQGVKFNKVIRCLLQFHIAEEETKFGLDMTEANILVQTVIQENWQNIQLCGVMGMASFVEDFDQIRREFKQLKAIFEQLKHAYFKANPYFTEISMGMSGDYAIAIEEGSTIVRIGSGIFGERGYYK